MASIQGNKNTNNFTIYFWLAQHFFLIFIAATFIFLKGPWNAFKNAFKDIHHLYQESNVALCVLTNNWMVIYKNPSKVRRLPQSEGLINKK